MVESVYDKFMPTTTQDPTATAPMYTNRARTIHSLDLRHVHDACKVGEIIYCNNQDGRGYGPAFKVKSRNSLAFVF